MTSDTRTVQLALMMFFGLGVGVAGCFGASGAIGIDPLSGEPIGHGAMCTAASECGGETPLCDANGICVECITPANCAGTQVCTGRGFCGECTQNSECTDGDSPLCDASRSRCVECASAADCPADQPICDPEGECRMACDASSCDEDQLCHPTIASCVECAGPADCGGDKPLCDVDTFECEECLSNTDCGAGQPHCVDGECSECIQNSDCMNGVCDEDLECQTMCMSDAMCTEGGRSHCDTTSGDCEECTADAHCEDADKPVSIQNECEECRTADDCQDGEACVESQCEGA